MHQKLNNALQSVVKIVGGILGFVVLMWIPKTGKGLLVYLVLFVVLVIIVVIEPISRKNRGHGS